MNNLEKILELNKSKGFKCLEDECDDIKHSKEFDCTLCSIYQVVKEPHCDLSRLAETLMKEYKYPIKLNKRERAFCEYEQCGYLARDKDGFLWWFNKKPKKEENKKHWFSRSSKYIIKYEIFKFITWEDEEAYSVEEMLTWEVEE